MRYGRFIGFLGALVLSGWTGIAHADENFAVLRLRYDLDAVPGVRVDFGLVGRPAEAGDVQRAWLLPLYDTRRKDLGPGFHHAEDSTPFCEKTLIGCLAIGAAMAAGIVVFIDEFSRQSRDDNEKLTVQFNTGTTSTP